MHCVIEDNFQMRSESHFFLNQNGIAIPVHITFFRMYSLEENNIPSLKQILVYPKLFTFAGKSCQCCAYIQTNNNKD